MIGNTCSLVKFRSGLLRWFDEHKRDLPWRKDKDPYRVWVSEIMLQQTRVAAVVPYYKRFVLRFPDVNRLARARESSVLAAWSGLGYYRRARALHAAARIVTNEYQGEFPANSEQLRTLPGIGRYTAAAIASIAFGERAAAVDGNVERVLARVTGELQTGEDAWRTANDLLAPRRPGDFNEAMMELGATICTPKDPQCDECPVRSLCFTKGTLNSSTRETRVQRDVSYRLSVRERQIYLVRRSKSAALMPGMWELPEAGEYHHDECMVLKHSITNTDYRVRVVKGELDNDRGGEWVDLGQVTKKPLTGLARKILIRAGLI